MGDTHVTKGKGNTKPSPRSRRWCFTLNNWSDDEFEKLIDVLDQKKCTYIVGKEVGTKGTPHLQGYIEFPNAVRFSTLKRFNERLHIEKARGSRDDNITYCSKEGDYESTFPPDFKEVLKQECMREYKGVEWKEWQAEILSLILQKPDGRKIRWYYEETGNTGKTFLAKYIALTNEVVICDGKKDNIFNQVKMCLDEKKIPRIVILDIPRSSESYINYGAIEKLKDGFLYSGKYEGGKCVFPHPHVIALANHLPELDKMSKDRWVIKRINI